MEGFYANGSRPQRNNNPGDLIFGSEAKAFGAISGDPRFAIFPDPKTGWKALQRWLSIPAKYDALGGLVGGYLGATLGQVVNRFAPPNENNTDHYIATVCDVTGLTPTTPITPEILQTPEAE